MSYFSLNVGHATATLGESKALPEVLQPLTWELSNVFVPEAHRKQGWGTKLVQEACSNADDLGKLLVIHINRGNPQLENWYAKFGFEKIQDIPEILMARSPGRIQNG